MILETSAEPLHFGVDFVVTPMLGIDQKKLLDFETRLAARAFRFDKRDSEAEHSFVLVRTGGDGPLQVKVSAVGPQLAQLLILAPLPKYGLDMFVREAEGVCKTYREVWGEANTVVHRDACIRRLYSISAKHAFQFIWEKRLGQSESDLKIFGRPVLGGGMRFVMPPVPGMQDPTQIEVKLESYLKNPKKLFVDVACKWPNPVPVDAGLDPKTLLDEVDDYMGDQVIRFAKEGTSD